MILKDFLFFLIAYGTPIIIMTGIMIIIPNNTIVIIIGMLVSMICGWCIITKAIEKPENKENEEPSKQ